VRKEVVNNPIGGDSGSCRKMKKERQKAYWACGYGRGCPGRLRENESL